MKRLPVWYFIIVGLLALALVVWSLLMKARDPASIELKEREIPINPNKFGDEESFEYRY
ncbi:MAG: hypothetical protein QXL01_06280 [Thermoplasmatales archaeon]